MAVNERKEENMSEKDIIERLDKIIGLLEKRPYARPEVLPITDPSGPGYVCRAGGWHGVQPAPTAADPCGFGGADVTWRG